MKIRELAQHWEENAKGRLTDTGYTIHLDVEAAARLAAIAEMYPKRHPEELLGELIGAALEEFEASLPYVKGSTVVVMLTIVLLGAFTVGVDWFLSMVVRLITT